MKTLIDTLEKFAAFNAKSKEMKLKEYSHRVHVQNGYKFATNGFYMLATKSTEVETPDSPDPACILNARSYVKTTVKVDVSELEQAIKNANVFAREGANMLVLNIANGMVFISAKSEEYGRMTRCLTSAEVSGPELILGFNCDYIRNCARYIAKAGTVTLEFNKPNSPAFVSGADLDKLACIMPMMVGDGEWVDDGAASLYCPELPGEKSFVWPAAYYPTSAGRFAWTEWEFVPQYRFNLETGKSEVIPNNEMPFTSLPACDAVTNELVAMDCGKSNISGDVSIIRFTVYTPAKPIDPTETGPQLPELPSDGKPSKSALMTALNKERARIRKAFKNMPARMQIELSRLYRAFGNLQRKNWKETTEKAPRNADNSLDWVTFTTTKKLYSLVIGAADQPIDVTNEFKSLKESAHVNA